MIYRPFPTRRKQWTVKKSLFGEPISWVIRLENDLTVKLWRDGEIYFASCSAVDCPRLNLDSKSLDRAKLEAFTEFENIANRASVILAKAKKDRLL